MLGRFWQNMPKEEKFLKQELKNAYEKVSTGTELRAGLIEMENLLDMKVNLQLWVKVKKDWRDSDMLLKNYGYDKKEV